MKKELLNEVFLENLKLTTQQKEETFTRMWEIIVGEFAHTGTTEVQSAKRRIDKVIDAIEGSYLNQEVAVKALNQASGELQEVQDMLWLYFTGEIQQNEIKKVDLVADIIRPADDKVRQTLSSLDVESAEHIRKVDNLPPLASQESIYIETHKTAANIVIKELFKFAYLHTNSDDPKVTLTLQNKLDEIKIILGFNKITPESITDWFNDKISSFELDNKGFHKSVLSHLRGVKRWYPKLGWRMEIGNDQSQNMTNVTIKLPIKFPSNLEL